MFVNFPTKMHMSIESYIRNWKICVVVLEFPPKQLFSIITMIILHRNRCPFELLLKTIIRIHPYRVYHNTEGYYKCVQLNGERKSNYCIHIIIIYSVQCACIKHIHHTSQLTANFHFGCTLQ